MELALLGVDEYAKELLRYINLNPVRAELVETPAECEWKPFLEQKGTIGRNVKMYLSQKHQTCHQTGCSNSPIGLTWKGC